MLRVDVDQLVANGLHRLQRHGRVVDEGTAFLLWVQLAAEEAFTVKVEVVFLEQRLQIVVSQFKLGFHHAFLLLVVEYACVGTVAQGKTQGAKQDGLAGTRFTCNDIESFFETDFYLVNQCVIADMQLL